MTNDLLWQAPGWLSSWHRWTKGGAGTWNKNIECTLLILIKLPSGFRQTNQMSMELKIMLLGLSSYQVHPLLIKFECSRFCDIVTVIVTNTRLEIHPRFWTSMFLIEPIWVIISTSTSTIDMMTDIKCRVCIIFVFLYLLSIYSFSFCGINKTKFTEHRIEMSG